MLLILYKVTPDKISLFCTPFTVTQLIDVIARVIPRVSSGVVDIFEPLNSERAHKLVARPEGGTPKKFG